MCARCFILLNRSKNKDEDEKEYSQYITISFMYTIIL